MADFIYPTSLALKTIEQELIPRVEEDDPVFEAFPVEDNDEWFISWEQMDAFTGLQQARGLNNEFPSVPHTGLRRFVMEPSVYGEYEPIDEAMLTTRRKTGTLGQPIDLADVVTLLQTKLLTRRYDRIRWILWTALTTGTYTVPGPNGTVLDSVSFTPQTFTAAIPWSTVTTATPLANFRAVKRLARGYSVQFNAEATAFMNQTTFEYLIGNFNPTDLYGRRTQGLGTFNTMEQLQPLFLGEDLPKIVVYDRTYRADSTVAFTNSARLFIPTGVVVVIGKRPAGAPAGRFLYARNANNPGSAPGAFTAVEDSADYNRYPRQLRVFDGFNGGPTFEFPSSIVRMNVA